MTSSVTDSSAFEDETAQTVDEHGLGLLRPIAADPVVDLGEGKRVLRTTTLNQPCSCKIRQSVPQRHEMRMIHTVLVTPVLGVETS